MRVVDWPGLAAEADTRAGCLPRPSALTIGVFDGIHRGHQKLIKRIAAENGRLVSTLITFRKNPKEFFKKKGFRGDILTLDQKLVIFERLSVDMVVLIDFSEDFSRMSGKEFLGLVRDRLCPGFVAVGSNFRCGYRGDTDAARLAAFYRGAEVPVEVVPPVLDGARPVSSSRIRSAIAAGDFSTAARLLGRSVEFDVSAIVPEERDGGSFYRTAALRRVIPGLGTYPAMLRGGKAGAAVAAWVVVMKDGIFVPRSGEAYRLIEFV
jgi:riboflavin kinase/FMN adenylyltransferase